MTTYFVKNGGNDSANGLSDANAWATISKVNGFAFSPGDVIQFKRGSEWKEKLAPVISGTSGNVIHYRDYDSGAKPIINGSDIITGWTVYSGNTWQATVTGADVTKVWFDGVTGNAEVANRDSLTVANDWFFDNPGNTLYVYSTSDPDTAFTSPGIEGNKRICVSLDGVDFLDFTAIHCEKGGTNGWFFDNFPDTINLFDCESQRSSSHGLSGNKVLRLVVDGGSYSNNGNRDSGPPDRNAGNGHGINLGATSTDDVAILNATLSGNVEQGLQTANLQGEMANLVVRGCEITGNVEGGMALKLCNGALIEQNNFHDTNYCFATDDASGGPTAVIFRRNIATGCARETDGALEVVGGRGAMDFYSNLIYDNEGWAFRLKNNNAASSLAVTFDHNTCYNNNINTANNGAGAASSIRIDSSFSVGTFKMRNNIVATTVSAWNRRCFHSVIAATARVTEQNNFWDAAAAATVITISGSNYSLSDINDATYTTATGYGQNSVSGAEDMVDPTNGDFHLNDSFVQAIQGGQSGLGITTDYDGTPFRDPPNTGALAGSQPPTGNGILVSGSVSLAGSGALGGPPNLPGSPFNAAVRKRKQVRAKKRRFTTETSISEPIGNGNLAASDSSITGSGGETSLVKGNGLLNADSVALSGSGTVPPGFAVITGAAPTSDGQTQDFTSSGFGTPSAAMFFVCKDTTDDATPVADAQVCFGMTDFTNQRFASGQTADNLGQSLSDHVKGVNSSVFLISSTGGQEAEADASTVTDGARLTWNDAPPTAVQVTCVLVSDIFPVAAGTVSPSTTVGGTVEEVTNIDQDTIFFTGARLAPQDSIDNNMRLSFGVATTSQSGAIANHSLAFTSDDANFNGNPTAGVYNNRCIKFLTQASADDYGASLTADSTTSFTLMTHDSAPRAGDEFYYLAINLGTSGRRRQVKVGSVDSPSTDGSWSSTALGFRPGYVGLGLSAMTAENAITNDDTAGSHGFSNNDGNAESCHSIYEEDTADPTNTNNVFRARAVYLLSDDTSAILHNLSHSSFDDNGWTYTQNSTSNSTVRKWFYWAVE